MNSLSDLKVGDRVMYKDMGTYVFGRIISETKTQFTAKMDGLGFNLRFMKDAGVIWGTASGWNLRIMQPLDQEKYDKQIANNIHMKLVDWFRSYSWRDLTTEELTAIKETLQS